MITLPTSIPEVHNPPAFSPVMPHPFRVICAWCGIVLKQGDKNKLSHGICHDCKSNILK